MKNSKTILFLLLILTLMFSAISCSDGGDTDSGGNEQNAGSSYVYRVDDNGEAIITRCKSKEPVIVIPDTLDGHPVTTIAASAFFTNTSVTEITVSNGIKFIEPSAFEGCSSLKKITIPASVVSLGEKVFQSCPKLEEVVIESGSALKQIGKNAFTYCDSLKLNQYENTEYLGVGNNDYEILVSSASTDVTSVSIHPDTRIIIANAFAKCSSITEVTIPEKVEYLGDGAFFGCAKLDKIYYYATNVQDLKPTSLVFDKVGTTSETMTLFVGDKVQRIPANLMNGASRLRVLRFIEGGICESIGEGAFANTPLPEVTIPSHIKIIESKAFYNCDFLEIIKLDAKNLADFSENNDIFAESGDRASGFTLTIGRNTERVPANFSRSMTNLVYIKFENNDVTKSFGKDAFFGCNSILRVDVTSRKGWCESTFANEYSNPLRYGNALLYVNDKSVTEGFVITEDISFISDYAFTGYRKMEKIIIPKSVSYIGKNAFYGAENLHTIYWGGNSTEWSQLNIMSGNSIIDASKIYFYWAKELGMPTIAGNFWYLDAESGTPNVWRNASGE